MYGAAFSVDSDDSTVAPAKAPTAPGMPSFQSTLPKRQWEAPAASVVPTSARCTEALAVAGLTAAQQGRGGDAVGHAEGAVDELGAEADEGEDEQGAHGSSRRVGRRSAGVL